MSSTFSHLLRDATVYLRFCVLRTVTLTPKCSIGQADSPSQSSVRLFTPNG